MIKLIVWLVIVIFAACTSGCCNHSQKKPLHQLLEERLAR